MISSVPLSQKISQYFSKIKDNVYTAAELYEMMYDFTKAVRSPLDAEPSEYLDWLVFQKILAPVTFTDKNNTLSFRYVRTGYKPSLYQLALTIRQNSYVSYISAAELHGFAKTNHGLLHITAEGSEKPDMPPVTDPVVIASAFKKKPRLSSSVYTFGMGKVMLHSRKFTDQAGVDRRASVPVTDPERTILDIVVRPFYAGGAQIVLEIFKNAIGRISVPLLIKYLDAINFAYPYHQAIGFYLEKAGYTGPALSRLNNKYGKTEFFLDYDMKSPLFNKKWQVYYPYEMKLF